MSGAGDDDTAAAMAAMGLPTNFASPNFGGAQAAGPSRQASTPARPPAMQQGGSLPSGPRALQDQCDGAIRGTFAQRGGRGFERGYGGGRGRGQGRGRGRGGFGAGGHGFHGAPQIRPQDQGYGQRVAPTFSQDGQDTQANQQQHWQSGGHNKRKRGGPHEQNGHGNQPLLPLDEIPPIIRSSFTEDPWAHLTK